MEIKKFDFFNESKKLKALKEHDGGTQNYMFFGNLKTIKRLVDKMLEMDEAEVDAMLNEHDWASDHITSSKDDIEEVFNFIASNDNPEEEDEDDYEPLSDTLYDAEKRDFFRKRKEEEYKNKQ